MKTAEAPRIEDVFQVAMMALIRNLGLHKADQTLCGEPVSVAEAHALFEIAHRAGLTQNSLALCLSIDKSTASRIAARLEFRGWIQRKRDGADSRRVLLSLTRSGIRSNARIGEARASKFRRIFEGIPIERRSTVLESLGILVEVISEP